MRTLLANVTGFQSLFSCARIRDVAASFYLAKKKRKENSKVCSGFKALLLTYVSPLLNVTSSADKRVFNMAFAVSCHVRVDRAK